METQKRGESPDWTMLPSALVGAVTGFLGLEDQARMGAVCRLWRLAMADSFCRRPPAPTVWLIVPSPGELRGRDEFAFPGFSLGERRQAIRINVEGSSRKVCIGSSEGLLMLADKLSRLQAFNPITKTSLWFPPEGGASAADGPAFRSFAWKSSYRKAIVVPPRGGRGRGGDDSVAVAILRRRGQYMSEVAFAVAGDDAWTELRASIYCFQDIAAHDGKLYGLGADASFSGIYVWDFGGKPRSFSAPAPSKIEAPAAWNLRRYLGVMSGDLILLWWCSYFECPIRRRRVVPEFRVHRLQTGRRPEWVRMKDLAGHAIVLGADGFTVLPADEPRRLSADCIYSFAEPPGNEAQDSGLTVFNLASGAVGFEPISPCLSLAFWFQPTLGSP